MFFRMKLILLCILTILHATYAKRPRPKPGKFGCAECTWQDWLLGIGIVVGVIILWILYRIYCKKKKKKTEDDSSSNASEMSVKDHPVEALPSQPCPEPVQPYIMTEPPPYPTPEESYSTSGKPYSSEKPYASGQPYSSGQPYGSGQPYTIPRVHIHGYPGSPHQPYSVQG